MNYTNEQKEKAKQENLPLIKIEVDFRYVKSKQHHTKSISLCGASTEEVAEQLIKIIRSIG